MGIRDEKERATRALARVGAIGIEIAVAICFGLIGGNYADKRFGTSPWLALVGLILGCAVSVRVLIGAVKAINASDEDA